MEQVVTARIMTFVVAGITAIGATYLMKKNNEQENKNI
jgi:hypothetical protein